MPKPPEKFYLMRYATAGIEFIITFGLLLFGGLMLDHAIGSEPAFTLVGGCLGFAGGLCRLIRQARQLTKSTQSEQEDDSSGTEN